MSDEYDTVAPPDVKRMKTDETVERKRILYVVLEGCSLESGKVGKDYVILCSDRHATFLRKNKKDPAEYRPDILHQASLSSISFQCLLNLLDSPLNRAGCLRVFFRTNKNILVQVSSQCRIPRTFDRFCGLMGEFLLKLFSSYHFPLCEESCCSL
uniref:FERM domain-containing protein n=1 Tax=Angiostrongylus cantonensis TaxID=6313 RepID=A0A0K0D694_ANGCA